MIFDKKRAASVILSKMDENGRSREAEMKPETGSHDAYTSFAEDLIMASKEGSVQGVAKVLREFHKMIEREDEVQDSKDMK